MDDVDDIVDGEHADETVVAIDNGRREKIVLLEKLRASSWSMSAGSGERFPA